MGLTGPLLLDYLRRFILWEPGDGYVKKLAGYHQFHAVRKSVLETSRAAGPVGQDADPAIPQGW